MLFSKGTWKLKKYDDSDEIASYIKQTFSPLIVANIKKDNRFENMHKSGKISIIAVPIKFNEIFWGILEGSSYNEIFFRRRIYSNYQYFQAL